MKHITHILLAMCLLQPVTTKAQTPYDSFAPETSRPMLEADALYEEIVKENRQTDTILCAAVIDFQSQSLYLVSLADGSLLASAPLTDEVRKWLSVDPLVDKNIATAPYMYCLGNPIGFIDPDGMDIYRYDEETGDFILYKQTDDDFDQVGKFKYNSETEQYELIQSKDGGYQTYSNHLGTSDKIAKGILRNNLNIKKNGQMFEVNNSKWKLSIDDFYNFALILDEITGKEISGFVLGSPFEEGKNYVQIEPYLYNTYNRSNNRLINFSPFSVLQHFHTHGHADPFEATRISTDDRIAKNMLLEKYPSIQLLIIHNYGSPINYTR